MENNLKFRNHPSIILENSLKTIGTVVFIFALEFISDISASGIEWTALLFLIVFCLIAIGIIIGIHAFIWTKTYIIIEENTLIVERNTLNKKRNTIGLKSVSNINLEQNMLEMLLGTCKVKLDTNSLSTADQTDVKIVLKKELAERFRNNVLLKVEETNHSMDEDENATDIKTGNQIYQKQKIEDAQDISIKNADTNTLIGDMGDIILHGLFSIRFSTLILLVFLIIIQVGLLQKAGMHTFQEIFAEVIGGLFATTWISVTLVWGIAKEFFKYLNFRIERKKDKVLLSYGLFKKVAYSVPIDKINGIRLTQTPIARIAKRYMVEIINVGMDDDENESNTFFLPYNKLETIKEQLHLLLPEFDGCIDIKEEKQSKVIWLLSVPWLFLYIVVVCFLYVVIAEAQTELKLFVLFAAVVILLLRFFIKLAGFLTKGIKVDKKFLKIVDGGFAKRTLFVKYDKIQYVTGKQCVIAKQFKIQKGTISLLASLKNRVQQLPYFKEADMEVLKNLLLKQA